MVQILPLLLWLFIVGQCLWSIHLVGKAEEQWRQGFQEDYKIAVCGRYLALAANLQAAVTTWRKMGCAPEEGDELNRDIEEFLQDWRERYEDFNPNDCADNESLRVYLHREQNTALDRDYPNWVVRYE